MSQEKINLLEGVMYPEPSIHPDADNTSKSSDTGEVRFDFNRLDLDDYALTGGKINLNSSLGIIEDHLYMSARKHLEDMYESVDIQLSDWNYVTTSQSKSITIRYKVEL